MRASAIQPAWVADQDIGSQEDRVDVSFVVPAFNAGTTLRACIDAIRVAAPPWSELVVVDDASMDNTAELATELADLVVRRPCRGGAARCRNDGAQRARGRILVFVDSDVVVTPSAVFGAIARMVPDSGFDAVFGSYEALPPEGLRNLATTYKNLLHHHTHLISAGEASTFWSGFGAIRRPAFVAANGFDCAVTTGADVEDVHLGFRLRSAGYRILLDPSLLVAHHKRYTVRRVIASDIFHRAIPWTKAMMELRSFRPDMNLRRSAIGSGLLADAVVIALVAGIFVGPVGIVFAAAILGIWAASCHRFLRYARRIWGTPGALLSAAMLFLYFLYGQLGALMGAASYVFRSGSASMENRLRLVDGALGEVAVTVAVVVSPGEEADALDSLPVLDPDWELLVVSEQRPARLPDHARHLRAQPGSTRNQLRDIALGEARGRMFATLDGSMVPDPGWLDTVRTAAAGHVLAMGGSYHPDHRSGLARAYHLASFWEWRPTRPAEWRPDHPVSNFAVRTAVARELGGFGGSELISRLGGFGAAPVRFEPAMAVTLKGEISLAQALRHMGGEARLRSAMTRRYRDLRLPAAVGIAVAAPVVATRFLVSRVKGPLLEGTADRSWIAALPFLAMMAASTAVGSVRGLLWPAARCVVGPRTFEELMEMKVLFPELPTSDSLPSAATSLMEFPTRSASRERLRDQPGKAGL